MLVAISGCDVPEALASVPATSARVDRSFQAPTHAVALRHGSQELEANSLQAEGGISSKSRWFMAGSSTQVMPARWPPSTFS